MNSGENNLRRSGLAAYEVDFAASASVAANADAFMFDSVVDEGKGRPDPSRGTKP